MSLTGEAFLDLLSENSNLKKENNPARKVIMNTIGEWLDNHSISDLFDNIFINTANEGYLDLFGNDFNVHRKLDETDDDYRERIVFEKLEHLTAKNLIEIYGLKLYAFVEDFNLENNDLTSDNPYLTDSYMSYASNDLQKILNNKFILDSGIKWL